MRVHELARKYDKSNKEFLELIIEWGIDVKSHLSGLTEEQVKDIENRMTPPKKESKEKKEVKKVKTKEKAEKQEEANNEAKEKKKKRKKRKRKF